MKKYILTLGLFSALVYIGCKKGEDNEPAPINEAELVVPYTDSTFIPSLVYTIYQPGDTIPNGGITIPLPAMNFKTDYKKHLAQYGVKEENVTKAWLTEFKMYIVRPAGKTFDFIDTVRISAAKNESLPEKLICSKAPVPKGSDTVYMDVINDDIKDYFFRDSMGVILNTHFNAIPDSTTRIYFDAKFKVKGLIK